NRLVENFLIYAQLELLVTDPAKVEALRQGSATPVNESLGAHVEEQAKKAGRLADLRLQLTHGTVAIQDGYLKKVVEEILDNAFKFSDPGTPVEVRNSTSAEGVTFTVRDHGHGMSAQHIADIGAYMQFERKVYEQQGSGLGLAIAKSLTQLHGGKLLI